MYSVKKSLAVYARQNSIKRSRPLYIKMNYPVLAYK